MNLLKANKTHIPFKLQFFGEPGSDPNPNPTNEPSSKTYSADEYNKLKQSFDKVSSEVAALKKQAQEKLTAEEKKALEDKALQDKLAEYESQLEDLNLEKALTKNNLLTSEEAQTILKQKGDKAKMLNDIMALFATKVVEAKKNAIAEFMASSKVSGGFPTDNAENSEIVEMAKAASKKNGKSKFF